MNFLFRSLVAVGVLCNFIVPPAVAQGVDLSLVPHYATTFVIPTGASSVLLAPVQFELNTAAQVVLDLQLAAGMPEQIGIAVDGGGLSWLDESAPWSARFSAPFDAGQHFLQAAVRLPLPAVTDTAGMLTYDFSAAAVPEPGSGALLLAGIAAVVGRRRLSAYRAAGGVH